MNTDSIADFLTRIRNAGMSRQTKVDVLNSRMNRGLTDLLVKEGYLKSSKLVSEEATSREILRVYLKYENGDLRRPVIQGLRRVSRPGLRKYVRADRLPRVVSGFGTAIISTSKGLLTDKDARQMGVGGEHICSVW